MHGEKIKDVLLFKCPVPGPKGYTHKMPNDDHHCQSFLAGHTPFASKLLCYFIMNNETSAVEMGTRVVNVLCQMSIKH